VDAADHEKIETSKTELFELLSRPSLTNIPLLVLANKRDLPNAMTPDQLVGAMYALSVFVFMSRNIAIVFGAGDLQVSRTFEIKIFLFSGIYLFILVYFIMIIILLIIYYYL